jgi:hypothetical protein
VRVNGAPAGSVPVSGHRLYELARTPLAGHGEHNLLELRFSPGVEAYAFTFGP